MRRLFDLLTIPILNHTNNKKQQKEHWTAKSIMVESGWLSLREEVHPDTHSILKAAIGVMAIIGNTMTIAGDEEEEEEEATAIFIGDQRVCVHREEITNYKFWD